MYQHSGVSFDTPSAWEVIDDDGDDTLRAITLECPNEGFYSIDIYKPEQAPTLEDYIKRSMQHFIEELPFYCKIIGVPNREPENAVNQSNEVVGVQLKFTVQTFLFLKTEYVSSYFRVLSGNKVSLISSQYSLESEAESRVGFNKILSSYIAE